MDRSTHLQPQMDSSGGPYLDSVRYVEIWTPDAQLIAMQTGVVDVVTDLVRASDIEKLVSDGFTVLEAAGYTIAYLGFNMRGWSSGGTYRWFLTDQNFRHAIAHLVPKNYLVPPIFGYVATPLDTFMPPTMFGWYNPNVTVHPFNPGELSSPPWDGVEGSPTETSVGILKYGGYYHDGTNWWSPGPDGIPLTGDDENVEFTILSELLLYSPTSFHIVHEIVAEMNNIGFSQVSHLGRDVEWLYDDIFLFGDFDMYFWEWKLEYTDPDFLYYLFHSQFDSVLNPYSGNSVGINSSSLDSLLEKIHVFDPFPNATDVYEAQQLLSEILPCIPIYSRHIFNAYNPNLEGMVNMPGIGSENFWTSMNMRWKSVPPKGNVVSKAVKAAPGLHPITVASTTCGATEQHLGCHLVAADLASNAGMQNPFTLLDELCQRIEFENPNVDLENLEVTFDLKITIMEGTWKDHKNEFITLIYVVGSIDIFLAICKLEGIDIPSEIELLLSMTFPRISTVREVAKWFDTVEEVFEGGKAKVKIGFKFGLPGWAKDLGKKAIERLRNTLPPKARKWLRRVPILNRFLWETANSTIGWENYQPWDGEADVDENGVVDWTEDGIGPWVFAYSDPFNMVSEFQAFREFYFTADDIHSILIEMFWKVGDYNRDGVINVIDLTFASFAYGCILGDPCYDEDADFNSDLVVDMRDMYITAYHMLWQKEWP